MTSEMSSCYIKTCMMERKYQIPVLDQHRSYLGLCQYSESNVGMKISGCSFIKGSKAKNEDSKPTDTIVPYNWVFFL